MITRTLKTAIIGAIAVSALFVLSGRRGEACGPFFLDAIFSYQKHPDIPLDKFVQGQIGVVKPSYARSYLFAAYRQLQGVTFDPSEQRALLEFWKERLDLSWNAPEDEWIKPWLDARSKVAGVAAAPKISLYRNREKPNEYESYLNCQEDAFATAAATLKERVKKFGADSAELKDWVNAQDAVFSNCSEGHAVPDAATAAADPLLRADRSYQIAAANFYAASLVDAENQFTSIARDNSSSWRPVAEYMVARTFLRQASLGKDEDKPVALTKAETKLKQILSDGALSSQHHASVRLLNLVRLRLHPEEKLRELAGSIIRKHPDETLKQDVWDYTALLDKLVGEDAEAAAARKEIPAAVTEDDVTDWIVTFQNNDAHSLEHALQRYDKTHSLPWLVAVLSRVDAKNPKTTSLLTAASKVAHHSSGFETVAFYRVRLLMEAGRDEEARNILDDILGSDRSQIAPSAVNLFLGLRMTLAGSAEEFLRDASRPPAGFSYDEDGREFPVDDPKEIGKPKEQTSLLFDQDAINFFNQHAPLSLLLNAATTKALPAHLRRDVAQAAWLRAALLDRREESARLIPVLSGFYPTLKELLATYQAANTAEERRFTVAYIALKFPGLRPMVTAGLGRSTPIGEVDSFRDNWWCRASSLTPEADATGDHEDNASKSPTQRLPAFLSKSEEAAAAREVSTLDALGVAPNYLSRTVIDWANKNPADVRVPEALHLAVTSTRRGCTDNETGRWSKAAFDLLHRRYPNSPWAKKTKYWFKD
ncbi:MAG: hypothetical protein ABJC05_04340 [Pyrinomonadaceae bacterium]